MSKLSEMKVKKKEKTPKTDAEKVKELEKGIRMGLAEIESISPDIPAEQKKLEPQMRKLLKKEGIIQSGEPISFAWNEVYDYENIKLTEKRKALARQWKQCKNYFRKGERPSQKQAIKNMDEMIDEL